MRSPVTVDFCSRSTTPPGEVPFEMGGDDVLCVGCLLGPGDLGRVRVAGSHALPPRADLVEALDVLALIET